jgi:hypothetical protein
VQASAIVVIRNARIAGVVLNREGDLVAKLVFFFLQQTVSSLHTTTEGTRLALGSEVPPCTKTMVAWTLSCSH